MKKERWKHIAKFKARGAFDTLMGLKTQYEISQQLKIHQIMVGKWKNELLERMPDLTGSDIYSSGHSLPIANEGRFPRKKVQPFGNNCKKNEPLEQNCQLSVWHQYQLLDIPRSVVYYQLTNKSPKNLPLMEKIDKLQLEYPAAGSRRMFKYLR